MLLPALMGVSVLAFYSKLCGTATCSFPHIYICVYKLNWCSVNTLIFLAWILTPMKKKTIICVWCFDPLFFKSRTHCKTARYIRVYTVSHYFLFKLKVQPILIVAAVDNNQMMWIFYSGQFFVCDRVAPINNVQRSIFYAKTRTKPF